MEGSGFRFSFVPVSGSTSLGGTCGVGGGGGDVERGSLDAESCWGFRVGECVGEKTGSASGVSARFEL